MVTITNDSYSCASGGVIAGGRQYAPAWAASLVPNTWTQMFQHGCCAAEIKFPLPTDDHRE